MPLDKAAEALKAVMDLGKNGYGQKLTDITNKIDSWEYLPAPIQLKKILVAAWGLDFQINKENNSFDKVSWNWESDYGSEQALKALAPFVTEDSVIEWKGEDGECWRQKFKQANLQTIRPKIVWEE